MISIIENKRKSYIDWIIKISSIIRDDGEYKIYFEEIIIQNKENHVEKREYYAIIYNFCLKIKSSKIIERINLYSYSFK